ncbi:MAG: C10 family peptidase [Bacteroidales bacterium]|nr:C10 family peptidase [Bacteroidales bacterium]
MCRIKTFLSALLLLLFLVPFAESSANPIPKDQLVSLGQEAFRQKLCAIQPQTSLPEVKSYFFIEEGGETYMAVLNFGKGFIIMAADDASIPVLAYGFEGEFSMETAAPGAKMFLEQYKKEIAAIRSLKLPTANDVLEAWQELKNHQSKSTLEIVVAPLLTSIWNQTKYYNQYSPEDEDSPGGYDGRTPNGCVAVAMAQIMYYYRYPEQGTGQHTNYTYYGNYTVNFGNETFNYEAMEDALSGYNNEVAKLIFDCATSVDMYYAPDGSGANSEDVPHALSTYFLYSQNAHYSSKWGTNNSQWRNYLKSDLNNNRPVYYSGYSDDGGHAFVCDGYNSDNHFHFNFGWGGTSDGFYALNNSDTYSNAVGGFSGGQCCVRNIYPGDSNFPFYCSEKIITSKSGTLEDGSQNLNYQNNQSCTYVITTDDAYMISVYIDRFATQENHDFLKFWDGHPSNGNLLQTLSGNITSNPSYNFNTDSLYVTFTTDDSITDAGWHLSFYIYRDVPNCTSSIFHEANGTITDGSGSSMYRDNANCYWSVRVSGAEALYVYFDEFDLSPEDHLYFYDLSNGNILLADYTGHNIPAPVIFNTGKIRISFISDNYLHADGFTFHWSTTIPEDIQEHDALNRMTIRPNPASHTATIHTSGLSGDGSVIISDLSGRTVLTQSVDQGGDTQIDVSRLKDGVYLVHILGEKFSETQKLIIAH